MGDITGGVGSGVVKTGHVAEMNPLQADVSVTAPHQLGRTPDGYFCYIECIGPDRGYSVGDRIENAALWVITPWVSQTEVGLVSKTSVGLAITDKGTRAQQSITNSRWKIVCVPYVTG